MNVQDVMRIKYEPPYWWTHEEVVIGNGRTEWIERFSSSQRHQSPANSRYRRHVTQNVTWREILTVFDFTFVPRKRYCRRPYGVACVRNDRRYGEIFYICCLFHEELTPSLCLTPWGFRCFGCGQDGDKVDFVAGYLGLRSAQSIKQYFADNFSGMTPRSSRPEA